MIKISNRYFGWGCYFGCGCCFGCGCYFECAQYAICQCSKTYIIGRNMLKKRQLAKSFLNITNTYLKGNIPLDPTQTHSLIRRKSERLLNVIKNQAKLKENQGEPIKICCFPPPRVQRSGSEVFSRVGNPKDLKELQSFCSLNTSTVTPPLTKRFQRKSHRKMEVDHVSAKQKIASINSLDMRPSEELNRFQSKNEKLSQRCEWLENENLQLQQSLQQKDKRITTLSSALKDKQGQLRKITVYLKQKQTICKQLEQTLESRGKLMSKLQQKSSQLESKLAGLKRTETLSAQQADFNQKVSMVMERLRYREMEVHVLKKESFELREVGKGLKRALRENGQLKERIKYLARKRYMVEIDEGSTSSLSYSCLSFAPDQI